jgi:DNA-binding NarL/FixJ family response regulator
MGFIGKGVDEAELLHAIRIVARGGRYVGPELADLLINGMNIDHDQPAHNTLSAREFQIFCRLAEGRTVSDIAVKLSLSVKTVSTYRVRLLDKMGMKTNADITTYAVRNSIVQ